MKLKHAKSHLVCCFVSTTEDGMSGWRKSSRRVPGTVITIPRRKHSWIFMWNWNKLLWCSGKVSARGFLSASDAKKGNFQTNRNNTYFNGKSFCRGDGVTRKVFYFGRIYFLSSIYRYPRVYKTQYCSCELEREKCPASSDFIAKPLGKIMSFSILICPDTLNENSDIWLGAIRDKRSAASKQITTHAAREQEKGTNCSFFGRSDLFSSFIHFYFRSVRVLSSQIHWVWFAITARTPDSSSKSIFLPFISFVCSFVLIWAQFAAVHGFWRRFHLFWFRCRCEYSNSMCTNNRNRAAAIWDSIAQQL